MRRLSLLFFVLGTAVLAACGVSVEQAGERPGGQAAVLPAEPVARPSGAPDADLHLAVDDRHAYLYRVGGSDYVSLGARAPHGARLPLKAARGQAKAIRLLAADPAQARAILRSLKLPASQRKLWMGEEIVLDAASYERLRVLSGKGQPLLMAQMELQAVRLEK